MSSRKPKKGKEPQNKQSSDTNKSFNPPDLPT